MTAKYDLYDVVQLRNDVFSMPHLAGMLGVVIARGDPDADEGDDSSEPMSYLVWFYGFDETWGCAESELVSTPYVDNVDKRWFKD